MDYSKAFLPISLCAHNSPLEGAIKLKFTPFYSSEVPFPDLPESKFSDSGRKPWTIIVRRFDQSLCVLIVLHWKVLQS